MTDTNKLNIRQIIASGVCKMHALVFKFKFLHLNVPMTFKWATSMKLTITSIKQRL